jgi:3' exoribonuclease, RNase T-like
MTLLFLDTEFTDFADTDLISIGLSDENGCEFYAELTDYRQEACNDFVRATVIPLLKQYPNRVEGTQWEVARALSKWLESYSQAGAIICFDYNLDWYLMDNLLRMLPESDQPDFLTTRMIWGDLDQQAIDYYWAEVDAFGHRQHHALYDARGNKYAYKPLVRERNG